MACGARTIPDEDDADLKAGGQPIDFPAPANDDKI
jgi:hypothetical protein